MRSIIAKAVNLKEFGNSQPTPLIEMIFDDLVVLLKFIYKAQKEGSLAGPFLFTQKIDYLDNIWHHFILHTRLYEKFCMEQFGEFLHHEPESPDDVKTNHNSEKLRSVISKQIELLEKNLGKDFVSRVFFIYPDLLKRGS